MYPSRGQGTENGGEMMALSEDGGPAFGAHAFIWADEWTPESAERVISGAAGVGLDFVEIPLLDPSSIDVEHTRSLLDRYGLGCSCSLGPGDIDYGGALAMESFAAVNEALIGAVARRGR
jgi:sugar phosphate isomerase/epimerase